MKAISYSFVVLLPLIFLVLTTQSGLSQKLKNSSMEGEPQDATMPLGWFGCQEGTTPDICPETWGVDNEPYDGKTYVGLITRPDGSWESIGQRLSEPLVKGDCYNFSIVLAHSDTYAGYDAPTRLRIWLGDSRCNKSTLLGETRAIRHYEWKQYDFRVIPEESYQYIILECYYPVEQFMSAGNILIDRVIGFYKCERS